MSTDSGNPDLLTADGSSKQMGSGLELRRLSSATARPMDLYSGNVTVAPPHHMSKLSNAHQTAMAMERAKGRLAEGSEASTPTVSSGVNTPDGDGLQTTDKYAFAFDIDGVLIKGGEVIPEAIEAMKVLNGQNEYNIKVSVHKWFSVRYREKLTHAC